MVDRKSYTRRSFVKIISTGAVVSTVGVQQLFGKASLLMGQEKKDQKKIELRTLGRTGLKYSPLGFGAMRTSDPAVIRKGVDMGINNIDTARGYMDGRNEKIVGQAVKGIRDKVYITTKIKPGSYQRMKQDAEKSLKALNTEYIDVLLIHGLSDPDDLSDEDFRKLLQVLKQEGKIRFSGFSTHRNEANILTGNLKDKFFDVVLVAYNFKSGSDLREAIAESAKAGIGIIAMKTQAGGYKDDKMGSLSPHPAALKWVFSNPNVASAIPSMVNFDQLEENFTALNGDMGWIDRKTLHRYGNIIDKDFCRLCGECDRQCPQGVVVSDINRCLMYAEGYRDMNLAYNNFREVNGSAYLAKCMNCRTCPVKCVNHLDVNKKIRKAKQIFA